MGTMNKQEYLDKLRQEIGIDSYIQEVFEYMENSTQYPIVLKGDLSPKSLPFFYQNSEFVIKVLTEKFAEREWILTTKIVETYSGYNELFEEEVYVLE